MLRVVKTENGLVRGIEAADPRITVFRGVPFAAPPVGKNRWRAPQPCDSWEGIRDASRFAPISVQDVPGLGTDIYCREWHVDPETPMDEDCLYLNIWTGAKSADEKLPVLVWFFGGAFQWGYPSEMEFDGERLARRGVIVVSVNYRLNVFGFLAHPQLTREQPEAPANFGNLDQQAGLQWVIRNIAAFGGDPENITIAGQSAGGGSVLSQMACPDNKGLFQRAVIMSAMIRNPYEVKSIGMPEPLMEAEFNGQNFFDFLGVSDLEGARALDAFYIRDKYAEYVRQSPRMATVLDGRFCIGDPIQLFLEGNCADVDVMAGNTQDEFPGLLKKDPADESDVSRWNGIEYTIRSIFGRRSEQGIGRRQYYYKFDTDIPGWDAPGTFHSSDLWFFFETLAKCWRPFTGHHYDLARQMCNYWCNFIRTGDPNGKDCDGTELPYWGTYTAESPCQMIFGTEGVKTEIQYLIPEQQAVMELICDSLEGNTVRSRHELEPVWNSPVQYAEPFAMIEEDGCRTPSQYETVRNICRAPFLYEPEEILRVESYDRTVCYEEGIDYRVENGQLVRTEDSRIPCTGWETFFHADLEEAEEALKNNPVKLDFGPVASLDGRYLDLGAICHPEKVTKWMTVVTYTTKERWKGMVPGGCLEQLPRFSEKLRKKEPVQIILYGDSISCGWDCSGIYGQQPGQPIWPELLLGQMREKWESPVEFHNVSVGGVDSEWAIAHAPKRVAAYHPDLVILGFGMNDRCPGSEFAEKTRRLMEEIQRISPLTEFLLIATTLPNELAHTAPMYFDAYQGEYSDVLRGLCCEGVILADVQEVQRAIQKKKRYIDLTGNWLNHPNDYLARVQAQVIAAVLGLSE